MIQIEIKRPLSFRAWYAKHFIGPINLISSMPIADYEFRINMYNVYLDKWLSSAEKEVNK